MLAAQLDKAKHWSGLEIQDRHASGEPSKGRILLRKDHEIPQIASGCSTLSFVSFAKPCLLGPSAFLLSLECTDFSPNSSNIFACLTTSIIYLCPLPQQETLLSAVLLRIFEAQQPIMSALDPKKNSCRFSHLPQFLLLVIALSLKQQTHRLSQKVSPVTW